MIEYIKKKTDAGEKIEKTGRNREPSLEKIDLALETIAKNGKSEDLLKIARCIYDDAYYYLYDFKTASEKCMERFKLETSLDESEIKTLLNEIYDAGRGCRMEDMLMRIEAMSVEDDTK